MSLVGPCSLLPLFPLYIPLRKSNPNIILSIWQWCNLLFRTLTRGTNGPSIYHHSLSRPVNDATTQIRRTHLPPPLDSSIGSSSCALDRSGSLSWSHTVSSLRLFQHWQPGQSRTGEFAVTLCKESYNVRTTLLVSGFVSLPRHWSFLEVPVQMSIMNWNEH